MTKKLDRQDTAPSAGDIRRKRAYFKEFVPAMVLYSLAVGVGTSLGPDTTAKKVFFMSATMGAALLGTWAIIRSLKRLDEYERAMTYQAMAISFGVAMIVALFIALAASARLGISKEVGSWAPFMSGMWTWAALTIGFNRR
jgi:hypothetical protein